VWQVVAMQEMVVLEAWVVVREKVVLLALVELREGMMVVQDKASFLEMVVVSEKEVWAMVVFTEATMITTMATVFSVRAVFWEKVVFSEVTMTTTMATTTSTTHMDPCQTTLIQRLSWHRIH